MNRGVLGFPKNRSMTLPFGLPLGLLRPKPGTPDASLGANSAAVTVTANASANTKGSYAELIPVTTFDCRLLNIYITSGGALRGLLIDIAIGPAGAEQVIIPDLLYSTGGPSFIAWVYQWPVFIPAGTRISARSQATTGSTTCGVQAVACPKELLQVFPVQQPVVETFGTVSSAASRGTSIDPGGSANTKGSWTALDSTEAGGPQVHRPIRALNVLKGDQNNAARANGDHRLDVGYYDASLNVSDVVTVLPDLQFKQDGNIDTVIPYVWGPLPVDIPAGVKLCARQQSDITDATDRLIDLALYGIS